MWFVILKTLLSEDRYLKIQVLGLRSRKCCSRG